MKVLLLNSSPHEKGHNYTAVSAIRDRIREKGMDAEIVWLGNRIIHGCLGCDNCMKIDRCVQDDDIINRLREKILDANALIVSAPVYFGGPNGNLCNAFDRIFYSRCVKDQLFRGKPRAAVTVCNTMGGETALMGIHRYFLTSQMPVASGMGFTTLTMKMCEEKNERFFTVVNRVADNIIYLLNAGELTNKYF